VTDKKGTKARAPVKNASARGGRKKGTSLKPLVSWAVLLWLAFAIFIVGLFIFNRDSIINSIETIKNETVLRKAPGGKPVSEPDTEPASETVTVTPPKLPEIQGTTGTSAPQAAKEPPQSQNTEAGQSPAAVQSSTAEQSSASTQSPAQSPELRNRVLYFTQVDRSGSILRVKVERRLPASNTPMVDVLQSLISGPTDDEKRKGLISLIPPGTRILSATVRDHTAYISFSEDFQYNTFGVEGYAGQLRQIVFTVTEFSNVTDVQFLIEGRRVDYLGEGIWIGSPLSRDAL